jgi:hypothetical protein
MSRLPSRVNLFTHRHPWMATIVPLRVDRVEYQIPRNYFQYYGALNVIEVSYPDFEPQTANNLRCFTPSAHLDELGCSSIRFNFSGANGPSIRQMFENFGRFASLADHESGPYGYEHYKFGHGSEWIEIYTKESADGFIYIDCAVASEEKRDVKVCNDLFKLDDNTARFFLTDAKPTIIGQGLLENVEDIQNKMRRLMASFASKEIGEQPR